MVLENVILGNIIKITLVSVVLSFLFSTQVYGQQEVKYTFTSKSNRDSITSKLKLGIDSLISLNADPLVSSKNWQGAFWAMELLLYKPKGFENKISECIQKLPQTNPEFQRSFLEMLYTLYPKKFSKNLFYQWRLLSNAKNQAMALEYLALSEVKPKIKTSDIIYGTGWYDVYIRRLKKLKQIKPLKKDFENDLFLPGKSVLCSFQSSDRDIPGYLMIRNSDGKWISDKKGNPYRFPQLARSISNLPYYLTNGNTPQGLYRITGTDTSENKWIGPTTNLQMVLPFENESKFFGGETSYQDYYQTVLGQKLSKFQSLYESFDAGKLGRTEIIAHGTTIDPSYYTGQKYYPCTPSLGCLCSPEIWSEDGFRLSSSQADWISLLNTNNIYAAWLVVAEIEDF